MDNDLPLLIDADQLLAHLQSPSPKLLILDTSSRENYLRHHIPSAVHLPPQALQCGVPPAPGKLPEPDHLQQLFSQVGLTPDSHVIACDDEGGGWAGRLIWTLDVLGHTRYSYLNGGLVNWVNRGYPVESGDHSVTPSHYQVSIDSGPIAEIDDIVPQLGSDQLGIWDARSAQEYDGSKVLARRGGHIPGAVNIDWLELMDRDNNLCLVDLDNLQQRLDREGLGKDKLIITHCQSHHRSGLSYLVMKILGYPNIKGYHGSWAEWGNRDDTPIE